MTRKFMLATIAGVAAVSPAWGEASMRVALSAHVDTFCRIYPPEDASLSVIGGSARIGQVREICNTPDGYDVSANFSNVARGQLLVDGNRYAIDGGLALRSSTQPAVRAMMWQLADAQLTSETAPVVMTVTITPRG